MVCEEKIDSQFCVRVWSHEKDILPVFLSTLLALVVISSTVMFALYFRAVYILWFRQNNDVKLSHQKRRVLRRNFQVYSGMMHLEYCSYLPIYLLNSLWLVRVIKSSTFGPDLSELSP